MRVIVRSTEGKLLNVDLPVDANIENLKREIETVEGVPADTQRILFNFRELADGSTMDLNGVEEGSVLDLQLRLLGGIGPSDIPDHLKELAHKYKTYKMICRKCYARLPINAHNCRKRKCGHCANIRPKKKIKDKEKGK